MTRRLSPFLAAAALTAMLFASHLPLSADFILPRHGGFWLYELAWRFFSFKQGRWIYSLGVVLLLLAAAFLFLRDAWRLRPQPLKRAWILMGAAVTFLFLDCFHRALDLARLALLPYGSMDLRQPVLVFFLLAVVFTVAVSVAFAWCSLQYRRAAVFTAILIVFDLLIFKLSTDCGIQQPLPLAPSGRAAYLVLTETPDGPGHELYVLPSGLFSGRDPRPDYRALAARLCDARAMPALHALYQEDARRWEIPALRQDLLLGAKRGDDLAPILLLSNLSSAALSPEARAALDAVADESAYRIGPLGAMCVSRAYAHLGVPDQAKAWSSRPGGIPAGLLGADQAKPFHFGRITGALRAPSPARVALYRWTDPSYLLDASGLVDSAAPDAKGRFSFTELPAGRYYLAFAFPASVAVVPPEIIGHRGDISLSAERSSVDLGLLTVSFSSRE